jgi:hypothetical protein
MSSHFPSENEANDNDAHISCFILFFSRKSQQPSFVETDDPKLSTLKDLVRITGMKINYSKLFDGIKSTDHKCMIIRRILAQKGVEGEPTVAKCKKLKHELQAKRESAELDKSVIITNEGEAIF